MLSCEPTFRRLGAAASNDEMIDITTDILSKQGGKILFFFPTCHRANIIGKYELQSETSSYRHVYHSICQPVFTVSLAPITMLWRGGMKQVRGSLRGQRGIRPCCSSLPTRDGVIHDGAIAVVLSLEGARLPWLSHWSRVQSFNTRPVSEQ